MLGGDTSCTCSGCCEDEIQTWKSLWRAHTRQEMMVPFPLPVKAGIIGPSGGSARGSAEIKAWCKSPAWPLLALVMTQGRPVQMPGSMERQEVDSWAWSIWGHHGHTCQRDCGTWPLPHFFWSWPWDGQLCCAECSFHDELCHHRPKALGPMGHVLKLPKLWARENPSSL